MFVLMVLICDVIKRGEVEHHPINAEPIAAGREGGAIRGGFASFYNGIMNIFYILCVGCVVTRLG